MSRVLPSILLGLFAPFVFIMGASPFEVVGGNSIKEVVAGSVAAALYLAVCQFLLAPKASRTLGSKRPTMVAMGASLLAVCLLMAATNGGELVFSGAGPMLIFGCLGILAGAVVAWLAALPVLSIQFCRRSHLTWIGTRYLHLIIALDEFKVRQRYRFQGRSTGSAI